jgi:hypothetical protein
MAHFALLDSNNVVTNVVVVDNVRLGDDPTLEEARGVAYLQAIFGEETRWVQTSYNARIRDIFASIGDRYDEVVDKFITDRPRPEDVLPDA